MSLDGNRPSRCVSSWARNRGPKLGLSPTRNPGFAVPGCVGVESRAKPGGEGLFENISIDGGFPCLIASPREVAAIEAPASTGIAEPQSRLRVTTWIVRSIVVGGVAGLVSGVLVGGVGGRLVMRLSALLDPVARELRVLTENGNRVGEFTLDGTLGLVVFTGMFSGLAAGVIWVVVRPWIGGLQWTWAVSGLAAVALGGFFVIDADNADFRILTAPGANVAMFLVLAFLLGALVVPLHRGIDRLLPSGKRHPPAALAVYGVLAGFGAVVGLPLALGGMLDEEFCACGNPPRAMGVAFLLTIAITVAWWIDQVRTVDDGPPTGRLLAAGRLATGVTMALGLGYLGVEIGRML